MLWFTQVVFRWRTAASTVWLLLLSVPTLAVFQLLSSVSPLHPATWISGWINGAFSLRSILFCGLYLSLLAVLCVLYSLTYTVKLPVYKTRLQFLWSVLRPSHALVVMIYALLGGGGGYCLAELGGYQRLWQPCDGYQRCLNEYQLLCILHGMFTGFCYGVNYFTDKEQFLVFPSIQQRKFFRLRSYLRSHLWEGFLFTLKGMRFFYPLYYFLGLYPRQKTISVFTLHLREDVQLDSIVGLLDAGLFLHLLLAGTTLHLSWSFGLRLFRVFHTEALRFPVVPTFAGEASRLLTTAMKSKSTPLLMHLGYLDLYQLSIHSVSRRKQVFSLNQSGQSAVWNDINSECLSLMTSLITKLGGKPQEEMASLFSPSLYSSGVSLSPTRKGWSDPPMGVLSPPGVTRRTVYNEKARLWSYSPGVQGVQVSTQPLTKESSLEKKLKDGMTTVKAVPKKVAEKLKRKPFFAFFLAELPETSNQEVFADSILHVWAITGISQLAVASYSEDAYGVVQRYEKSRGKGWTLPKILNTLLSLSQALDKHAKAPLSSSRSTRNIRRALEMNGKYAIKTAVQTALHQLTITFAKERRSLQLSEEQLLYWNTFIGTTQQ